MWSYFEAYEKQPEVTCFFRSHIFYAHVLYHEVLPSVQNAAVSLVISKQKFKKILRSRLFLVRKTKDSMNDLAPLLVEVSIKRICTYQPFSFDKYLFSS